MRPQLEQASGKKFEKYVAVLFISVENIYYLIKVSITFVKQLIIMNHNPGYRLILVVDWPITSKSKCEMMSQSCCTFRLIFLKMLLCVLLTLCLKLSHKMNYLILWFKITHLSIIIIIILIRPFTVILFVLILASS